MNRLEFPAAQRNRDPILEELRRLMPGKATTLLEIASGSGEHAVHFARQLPQLTIQPTDFEAPHRASIDAWVEHEGLQDRVRPALALDTTATWPLDAIGHVDLIYCANMIHIAPWPACVGLFRGAQRLLETGEPLVLYGPFLRRHIDTADSNVAFDASLKSRNEAWGIRDLDEVISVAADHSFALDEVVEMPANNLIVVFRRLSSEWP